MSAPEQTGPLHRFILQAIDPSLGCPVLEMMLRVTELDTLRKILGDDASSDTDLQMVYILGSAELRAIDNQYGARFNPDGRECHLAREHPAPGRAVSGPHGIRIVSHAGGCEAICQVHHRMPGRS
jgi:hypothetical protein